MITFARFAHVVCVCFSVVILRQDTADEGTLFAMPSANAKQTSSLSSTLGIGSDNDQALPGGHGRFIDDAAELGFHLPSTAMQVFRFMDSN